MRVAVAALETPLLWELLEARDSFRTQGWAGPVRPSQAWSPAVELEGARPGRGGCPELIQGLFSVTQPCPGARDREAQRPRETAAEGPAATRALALGCCEYVPQALKAVGHGARVRLGSGTVSCACVSGVVRVVWRVSPPHGSQCCFGCQLASPRAAWAHPPTACQPPRPTLAVSTGREGPHRGTGWLRVAHGLLEGQRDPGCVQSHR